MPAERPALILQMQRMGDLVLTFPLMNWLLHENPDRPIWVMAERVFFDGLLPLSPAVKYLQAESISMLMNESFGPVINLSHRDVAARVCAMVESEEAIGPIAAADGSTYIRGAAQLYRASIVHNNRANRFHWADLNGLDCVSLKTMRTLPPPPPVPRPQAQEPASAAGGKPVVGLFVGASEAAKRPDPGFFGWLARRIASMGMKPVLLGGPDDTELAAEAARSARMPDIDLSGKFTLTELVEFGRTLSLMITPDTGPMHLSSFAGITTLDLSVGPVAPWDTGPYPPGHYVLQAAMSCVNCWRCTRAEQFCRAPFRAEHVAQLAHALVNGETPPQVPGARLYRSARDRDGLYTLTPMGLTAPPDPTAPPLQHHEPVARIAVSRLWRTFFGSHFGTWDTERLAPAWTQVAQLPGMEKAFARALAHLGAELAKALKSPGTPLPREFWSAHPAFLRPLTGYAHLALQNDNYRPAAFAQVLTHIEQLVALARP